MFKKIIHLITGKQIASINLVQRFFIYRLDPEVYVIQFWENFLERRVEIKGSQLVVNADLWKGTEIYVLAILPWLNGIITNNDLITHIDLIKEACGVQTKKQHKSKDNNVVEISKWLSNKSAEDQNEV